ncbi:hypothetical protein [Kitasatospora sp. NPDC059827]|uniref:hypothetical protein n=1 Tax=Kitasatospora sp. NPDC059827 TaxID=3346964 RepID=UPI00365B8B9B
MAPTRLARPPDGRRDDLVARIVRAVSEGDGAAVDVLLAVLEAVADEPTLRRLSAELRHLALPPTTRPGPTSGSRPA